MHLPRADRDTPPRKFIKTQALSSLALSSRHLLGCQVTDLSFRGESALGGGRSTHCAPADDMLRCLCGTCVGLGLSASCHWGCGQGRQECRPGPSAALVILHPPVLRRFPSPRCAVSHDLLGPCCCVSGVSIWVPFVTLSILVAISSLQLSLGWLLAP